MRLKTRNNERVVFKRKMQPQTADADVQLKNNYSVRTNEQHFINGQTLAALNIHKRKTRQVYIILQ